MDGWMDGWICVLIWWWAYQFGYFPFSSTLVWPPMLDLGVFAPGTATALFSVGRSVFRGIVRGVKARVGRGWIVSFVVEL